MVSMATVAKCAGFCGATVYIEVLQLRFVYVCTWCMNACFDITLSIFIT